MPVDMGEIIDDTKPIASRTVGDIYSFRHLTFGTVVITDDPSLLTSQPAEGFPGHPVAGRPSVRQDCWVLQLLPAGGGGRGSGALGRVGPSQRVEMVRQCRESGPKIELRTAFSASK
jgi:hypothetical protein